MNKQTFKGLAVSSLSTSISFIIQTVATIILARIFTPKEFGAIAAVSIITNYADIVWQLGLGPSIVQKKEINKGDVSTANIASIFLGVVSFLIISLFSKPIAHLVGLNNSFVLVIMSISFIINSLSAIPNSLLQRELLFSKIAVKDIAGNIVYLASAVLFGFAGLGVWALVYAMLLRYLISLVLVLFYARGENEIDITRYSWISFSTMMNFGVGYSISRFLNVTTSQIDYLAVSKLIGEVALGIYSKAFQLMSVPANLIGQVVDLVFFPIMSKSQENNKELESIFLVFTNIMALFSFPVSVGLYLFSEEFIQVFLGNNWLVASAPLKILGISLFFRIGYKITDPLFRAKGAVYERALLHLFQAVLTGICSFTGAEIAGITGVAIGVTFSLFLNYFFIILRVSKLINLKLKKIVISIFYGMCLNYLFIPLLEVVKTKIYSFNLNFIIQFLMIFLVWVIVMILINLFCIKVIYQTETLTILKKRFIKKEKL